MIFKCIDMVVEFWIEVISVSGVLAAGEDEADLVAFEVDLNEGQLNQVRDALQMNGGVLVLFVVLFYAGALRELSHLLR